MEKPHQEKKRWDIGVMYRRFSFSWSRRQKCKKSRKIKGKWMLLLQLAAFALHLIARGRSPRWKLESLKVMRWKTSGCENLIFQKELSASHIWVPLCPSLPSLPPALDSFTFRNRTEEAEPTQSRVLLTGTCHAGQVNWACGISEMLLISLCSTKLSNLQMAKIKIGSLGTGSQHLKGIYD